MYHRCASRRWHFHVDFRNVKTGKHTWRRLLTVGGKREWWQERGLAWWQERSLFAWRQNVVGCPAFISVTTVACWCHLNNKETRVHPFENNGHCTLQIRKHLHIATDHYLALKTRKNVCVVMINLRQIHKTLWQFWRVAIQGNYLLTYLLTLPLFLAIRYLFYLYYVYIYICHLALICINMCMCVYSIYRKFE